MHNKKVKYIYCEDRFGFLLGYVDDIQSISEDEMFVTIISTKKDKNSEWNNKHRDTKIVIDLKTLYKWIFFENYEEFCIEHFDGIL